ncbi:MAG: 30S ribosomal protein S17 [Phycisphaerales bacterium]|nr:30S ribosomal protein S17 [Phycisphaerales bacterium]
MTTTQKKAAAASAKPVQAGPAPKRARRGRVEADGRDKTRTVVFEDTTRHPKYGKYIRTRTHVQVHDEANASRTGDTVEVAQCRPMSKTKNWRLVRVVQKRVQD